MLENNLLKLYQRPERFLCKSRSVFSRRTNEEEKEPFRRILRIERGPDRLGTERDFEQLLAKERDVAKAEQAHLQHSGEFCSILPPWAKPGKICQTLAGLFSAVSKPILQKRILQLFILLHF